MRRVALGLFLAEVTDSRDLTRKQPYVYNCKVDCGDPNMNVSVVCS